MRDSVVNNKSLHHLRERTRDSVCPEQSGAVNSSAHEEITETHSAEDITPGWSINQDRERRAFICTVNFLVTSGGP